MPFFVKSYFYILIFLTILSCAEDPMSPQENHYDYSKWSTKKITKRTQIERDYLGKNDTVISTYHYSQFGNLTNITVTKPAEPNYYRSYEITYNADSLIKTFTTPAEDYIARDDVVFYYEYNKNKPLIEIKSNESTFLDSLPTTWCTLEYPSSSQINIYRRNDKEELHYFEGNLIYQVGRHLTDTTLYEYDNSPNARSSFQFASYTLGIPRSRNNVIWRISVGDY